MNSYTKRIIVFIVFATTFLTASARECLTPPEKFARELAQVFIQNDRAAFEKYLMTKSDWLSVTEGVKKLARADERYKDRLSKIEEQLKFLQSSDGESKHQEFIDRLKESYDVVMSGAKNEGIDLTKAKFGKIIKLKVREEMNHMLYRISFTVVVDGEQYEIRARSVHVVPRGLVIAKPMKWNGKRLEDSITGTR